MAYQQEPYAIYVANDAPKKAREGMIWYDKTNNQLKVLVGSTWKYVDMT